MSLSIAWSSLYENGSQSIAFSDSCGYITLVNLNDQLIRSFKAHNFESWIVTYNYWEPNILYTGKFIISTINYYSLGGSGCVVAPLTFKIFSIGLHPDEIMHNYYLSL